MERKVLNYGFVRLVDSMPIANETDNSSFEASIAQMARVSYGKGTKIKNLLFTIFRQCQTKGRCCGGVVQLI